MLLVVYDLEQRMPFRQIIRYRIRQISNSCRIGGFRIQISGRLGGSDIARTEWVRKGQVPSNTILAILDYSCTIAQTIYGSLGVKVCVFFTKNL